ncbi:HAD family phosphatase [Collinsella tanakaei]|nr:HAD family phosphatase [Collinsella tanakaei]
MSEQRPARPRAFIFDCDGTLLSSMGMWLKVQVELLATYGIETTPDDFARFESLPVMGECEAYHETWGVGESGQDVYDRLMGMLMEHYRRDVPPRRGVRDFLESAREAGIPMIIATSTPVVAVEAGLEANGLRPFFCDIVTTGEAGASKDHPDVYNLALQRLSDACGFDEVPAHRDVWVFEDATFGLLSSGSAGYRRVGIYDPEGRALRDDVQANSEIFIDEFDELSLERIYAFGERA